MFLLELFSTISARCCSNRRHNEEGAEITRRLRELLDLTKPKQFETPSTITVSGHLPHSQKSLRREES
jgi:hypothetical protein